MDKHGNVWDIDKNLRATNIETLKTKQFSADTLQLLQQIPKEEFEKVIRMNRAHRRKWFRENKISRLVDKQHE